MFNLAPLTYKLYGEIVSGCQPTRYVKIPVEICANQ